MNPYFILLFVVFSSFVFGLIGFVDALIIIPIITPIIGIKNAVIFSNLWGLISATLNSIRYRKHLDKQFLLYTLSMGIIGTVLGTLAISIAPVRWIELSRGCISHAIAFLPFRRSPVPEAGSGRTPPDTGAVAPGGTGLDPASGRRR